MYQTHKTYIRPEHIMSELVTENPSFLLMMEYLGIDFCISDKTVGQVCSEHNISLPAFLIIGNLYNGFFPNKEEIFSIKDISIIIRFLKNSHRFYIHDKYPEIQNYIRALKESQNSESIQLIEKFFNSYFDEVLEHLNYEDEVAFPYFFSLIDDRKGKALNGFSANEYREHHTDIETKLNDLKNLLLKHIILKDDLTVRRKFLHSLLELESDLQIHSIIEEKVLLPLIDNLESEVQDE